MSEITITNAEAMIDRTAKKHGGGAHVIIPKDWMGCSVKVILLTKESTLNLCKSCTQEFATCNGDPKFGNGLGHDNVYECKQYLKLDGPDRW